VEGTLTEFKTSGLDSRGSHRGVLVSFSLASDSDMAAAGTDESTAVVVVVVVEAFRGEDSFPSNDCLLDGFDGVGSPHGLALGYVGLLLESEARLEVKSGTLEDMD
jgi:hypothetical protein